MQNCLRAWVRLKASSRKFSDPDASPVMHPPRMVPVALRKPLKDKLQRMEKLGVIKKSTESTAWVHSHVVAKKKNNKLRACLTPSDLNRAVMRKHFPMQTMEDGISRIHNAKVFSILDANHGFWQVKLAKDSSKLATFNTPFGRYSYTRLPFGIASAPEVFQNVMFHLFWDIEGVEVIVDDLVVWREDTEQHDVRLRQVLDRCCERNLKLDREKCPFSISEVHYVGHVLSADGVKQRFLGVVTYLSKFIPNMSQKSAPLCQLLQKDIEWSWGQVEDDTFTCLKASISSAPVLKFFDPKEPVTLSVDANSKGVGAVLLQNDPPVAPELQQLQKVVMSGWLQTKVKTPVKTTPYWNYRDEISCYEG